MSISGMLEMVDGTLTDTASLAAGKATLFILPLGQTDPLLGRMKEARDTNMHVPGMLPAPQKFVIQRISCALFRGDALVPLADSLWKKISVELAIDAKTYGRVAAWAIANEKLLLASLQIGEEAPVAEWLAQCKDGVGRFEGVPATGLLTPGVELRGLLIEVMQFFAVYVQADRNYPDVTVQAVLHGQHFLPVK